MGDIIHTVALWIAAIVMIGITPAIFIAAFYEMWQENKHKEKR